MGYRLKDLRRYVPVVEGYHRWRPRVKDVVGQQHTQPPQSPRGVLAQRRQAREADPRTNRAIFRAKEEDPGIQGGLADDGSDADNLRKQACLVCETLTAHTAVVVLRLHRKENHRAHSIHFRIDWERPRADPNGKDGIACRLHPRPQLEGG